MADEYRLSGMETLWSVVQRAHGDDEEAVHAAREQLIHRYGNAVRKYLLGALRSENDANEVFQEFFIANGARGISRCRSESWSVSKLYQDFVVSNGR